MKKIISRILSLTIILALTLCLAACGENTENTDTKPAAATETANVTNTPEEPEKTEETTETEDKNTEEPQDETPKTEDSNEEGTQPDNDKVPENTVTEESKVSDYVKNNGSTLTSRLETELSAKNIASTCTVSASGTRLVFTCKLSDYNDLSESDKSKIKIATIALKPTANSELAKITETEPAVTGADFKICETDGDLITTISVSK